ncbi:nuclear transport factor 2 family protein [Ancylobacter sp. G4_0304]|uniref:nuclear transport factor 2 family protein n=1 Tax=Ancylobacter sp. G4_0304 TaxID=3114289 RepID=UPI0039C62477
MNAALPAPVLAYFRADAQGPEAVARCFTPQGEVRDEGHRHVGHDAIRQWKEAASTRYNYTSEPVSWREQEGCVIVTARVAGDFPGSPVELTYRFVLTGEALAALEIVP